MASSDRVRGLRSSVLGSLDRALDSVALTRRGRFWFRLLRRASPQGVTEQMRFVTSAIRDTCAYMVDPDAHITPRARHPLVLRLRDSGINLRVRADTDDIIHVMPGREQDVHDAILESVEAGDMFVDVGANIGYYSVLAARKVGPRGRVVAVEPVASTAATLRGNLNANGLHNVEVVEVAAGADAAPAVEVSFNPRYLGRATLQSAPGSVAETVPQRRLDDICNDLPVITVLKIDVEGYELRVLKGAERTLQRTQLVVVECNDGSTEVDRFLEARGFSVVPLRFANHRLARRETSLPKSDLT